MLKVAQTAKQNDWLDGDKIIPQKSGPQCWKLFDPDTSSIPEALWHNPKSLSARSCDICDKSRDGLCKLPKYRPKIKVEVLLFIGLQCCFFTQKPSLTLFCTNFLQPKDVLSLTASGSDRDLLGHTATGHGLRWLHGFLPTDVAPWMQRAVAHVVARFGVEENHR